MAPTVAVVGAGTLGLAAMKNLKDDGFHVTGFEARSYLGGLWRYNDDGRLSVQESTIFNSSKLRSAFTDFPFDDDVDDFPTWQQMYKYLNSYADHFGLRELVHLNSSVKDVKREGDTWVLVIVGKDGKTREERFDRLLVATGSFTKAKTPHTPGIEKFKGRTLHALNFHESEKFKGQNVLLVGLHATSQDVAKCLVGHAKQVYISHRNGVVILARYAKTGAVFDVAQTLAMTNIILTLTEWFPNFYNWLYDKMVNAMSRSGFPDMPKEWKLSPAPPPHITNPLVGDELYALMESGFAQPVMNVTRITGPNSMELADGASLEDIDAIVYCTGYDYSVDFLPEEFNPYPVVGQPGNFYRGIFPLHEDAKVRNSLAFMGHIAVTLPGLAQWDLCAMAISQTWLGKHPLPPLAEMKTWHVGYLRWWRELLASSPVESTAYVGFVPLADHLRWLDKTAGTDLFSHFGWGSKGWSFWNEDKDFYRLCKNGLFSPALWRLFATGGRKEWSQAKEQIYKDNESAKRQIEKRMENLRTIEEKDK